MVDPGARRAIYALYRDHKYTDAAEAAHRFLQKHPQDLQILEILGDSALNAGQIDAGDRTMDFLLAQQRTPHRLASKAVALSAKGDFPAAVSLLKEALAIEPAHARSWSLMSGLYTFRRDDPFIARAKRVLKAKGSSDTARRAAAFALTKAMNDLRKWDKAWDYAALAGEIATPAYDPTALDRWIRESEKTFDPDFLSRRPTRGAPSSAPIFIVGMPRSGTTLMEIILAATGQVAPLGEMRTIADFCEVAAQDDSKRGNPSSNHMWVRRWGQDAFTRFGEHYLSTAVRYAGGEAPVNFTDKLPGNVMYLGQIALALPNARIIRMLRDPLDTCVSCFLGQFAAGHQYTNRIDWLAHAAQAYRRVGDTMLPMLPNPVLNVQYETLVANPEAEIRRVLDFLNLDWTPECLTPSQAEYTTTTRSVQQVRKPINASSVGNWRRYANRVGPLAEALGIDLSKAA